MSELYGYPKQARVGVKAQELPVVAGGRVSEDAQGLVVDALTQGLKHAAPNLLEMLPVFFGYFVHTCTLRYIASRRA